VTPLLADRIDAVLPQTQCTRCGYDDCRAYAEAIAAGEAGIDRCPPGGAEGVRRLAAVTGQPARALDPAVGTEGPRLRAVIDEAACIGCTRCLAPCPADCIVGGAKSLHVVIADLCTGCERCVPACPVDCIALETVDPARTGWAAWSAEQAAVARRRYAAHRARLDSPPDAGAAPAPAAAERRALLDAVLRRAREARR
jgi:electron transport complex protein RnfB